MYISRSMEQALLESKKQRMCYGDGDKAGRQVNVAQNLVSERQICDVTLRESLAKKVLLGVIQRAKRVSSVG